MPSESSSGYWREISSRVSPSLFSSAQPLYIIIDKGDPVPCCAPDQTVGRQVELALERTDSGLGVGVEHAVGGVDLRNVRVVGRDAVEAVLDGAHILAVLAKPQRDAGEGLAERGGEGRVGGKIDVVAVKGAYDFLGGKSLLGERDRAPLAQAAGTGDGRAVAVLREQAARLHRRSVR